MDLPRTLCELSPSGLEAAFAAWGEPAFRARQVYRQLYVSLADSPAAMTDLPAALRERLAREIPAGSLRLERVLNGDRGMTRKALFVLPDGAPVEAVLMIYRDRATACVSTQSGCAVGCTFCATGRMGFRHHLTPGQMVEQVLWAAREAKAAVPDGRTALSNVVYMGMGEPFYNYDHWWASVERLHDPEGFNLGARGFTVSTVGIVPGILRLAKEPLPVNLAISLHAPDDELRSRLVPVNRRYPIARILEAVRSYTDETRRRVSFEYVLLDGVNDAPAQAEALASLLRGMLCHVNLIPWNPVPGAAGSASARVRVLEFEKILAARHVPCTVRVQRGADIGAACGQLAGTLNR